MGRIRRRQCQTSQMYAYPAVTAVSVKGTPIRMKSRKLTSQPCFFRSPTDAILADAPIGVRLPPSVAPQRSPKKKT